MDACHFGVSHFELLFGRLTWSPCFLHQLEPMSHMCLIQAPGFLRRAAAELCYCPDISSPSVLLVPAVPQTQVTLTPCRFVWAISVLEPPRPNSIIHELGKAKWIG